MGGAPSLEEGKFEEVGRLYMETRNGIIIIIVEILRPLYHHCIY